MESVLFWTAPFVAREGAPDVRLLSCAGPTATHPFSFSSCQIKRLLMKMQHVSEWKKKMKSERKKNGRRCLKDPPTCRRNVRIDVLVQFESADQVDLSTTSATCSTFFCRSGGRVVKHGSLKVGSWKKERSSFNGTISARQKLVSVKCFLKGKRRRRRRRRTDLSIRERRRRKWGGQELELISSVSAAGLTKAAA